MLYVSSKPLPLGNGNWLGSDCGVALVAIVNVVISTPICLNFTFVPFRVVVKSAAAPAHTTAPVLTRVTSKLISVPGSYCGLCILGDTL